MNKKILLFVVSAFLMVSLASAQYQVIETQSFNSVGNQTYNIPDGTTHLNVTIKGAQGGQGGDSYNYQGGNGGAGATASFQMEIDNTQDLYVGVGGQGGNGDDGTGTSGYVVGGAGGGGGSSAIQYDNGTLLACAGGGGGGSAGDDAPGDHHSWNAFGGAGGNGTGETGESGRDGTNVLPGSGGTGFYSNCGGGGSGGGPHPVGYTGPGEDGSPGSMDYQINQYTEFSTGTNNGDGSVTITALQSPPPQPDFTITPNPVNVQENTTLDAADAPSGYTIDTYEWDVDNDGTYEKTGQTIEQTYNTIKDQPVVLKATYSDARTNTKTKDVLVRDTESPVIESVNPEDGDLVSLDEDFTATFSDNYDLGPDGYYNFTINGQTCASGTFQDNTTSIDVGPANCISNLNQGYGNHTWEVEVVDDSGSFNIESYDIRAVPPPDTPSFDVSTTNPDEDTSVQFNLTSSTENLTAIRWDFDNDSISDATGENVSHTYSEPGIYTAEVTVYNPSGTATATTQIDVNDITKPNIHNIQFNQENTTITGTNPTQKGTISFNVSDNEDVANSRLYINGNLAETYSYTGSGDLEVSSSYFWTGTNTTLDLEIEADDSTGNTRTVNTTIDVDTVPPKLLNSSFEVQNFNRSSLVEGENMTFTINTTEASTSTGTIVFFVGDTQVTDTISFTPNQTEVVEAEDYINTENLQNDLEANIFLYDQYENRRTIRDYETGLEFDSGVSFYNYQSKSPIGSNNLTIQFNSIDNLTKIETEISFTDSDPILQFSYSDTYTDSGFFGETTYIEGTSNVTITNPRSITQVLYGEGGGQIESTQCGTINWKEGELATLPAGESVTLNLSEVIYMQACNFTDKDFSTGEIGGLEDSFRTEILVDKLNIDNYETSDGGFTGLIPDTDSESTMYSAEGTVNSPGVYNIRFELEDSLGNNKTIEREAKVRPNNLGGTIHQFVYNTTGWSDWVTSAAILILFQIGGAALIELKTRGQENPNVRKFWMYISPILLYVSGILVWSVQTVVIFLIAGLITNKIKDFLTGR